MSRAYIQAAEVLAKVLTHKSGLKSATYNSKNDGKKMCYKLVAETLKYSPTLKRIINETNLKKSKDQVKIEMLLIMLYEHLFGQGIRGGGLVKRLIKENDVEIREKLLAIKAEKKVTSDEDLLPVDLRNKTKQPRYARVNLLKLSLHDALIAFKELKPVVDAHLNTDLLVFPPSTDLHDHELVKNGSILLQDKASCFPATILMAKGRHGGDSLDACAAPGNKTSHLASLMSHYSPEAAGKVYAFEKDETRYKLLSRRMVEAGASEIVKATLGDFLQVDSALPEFAKVKAILLDPSCSGSGMMHRVDHAVDSLLIDEEAGVSGSTTSEESSRLEALASFQLQALLHAMSFPSAQRLTYSTCSKHDIENEDVVAKALASQTKTISEETDLADTTTNTNTVGVWELKTALPSWPRRGMPHTLLSAEQSAALVRAAPEDGTNGFFVAYFERTLPSSAGKRKRNKRKQERKKEKKLNATGHLAAAAAGEIAERSVDIVSLHSGEEKLVSTGVREVTKSKQNKPKKSESGAPPKKKQRTG